MDNIFIQLAIILGLSSVLGFVTHKFSLPLLVAYLFGGLILASSTLFDFQGSQALSFLPEIGIAFVLFLVGMELDLREVKNLGKPIIVSALFQIIITTILGSSLAKNFGFSDAESWYLGLGLSFSSTIVVVKLLLDKKDLTSLYGKLALGILILEDLLAVLVLLALTVSPSFLGLGLQQTIPVITFVAKVLLLFGSAFLLNRYLLTAVFSAVAKSGELLFLTALSWCFIFVSFSIFLGFSVMIGAFLAGVALAASPYHFQIQGKVKPLRDFFITLFFVYLGTQVNFSQIREVLPTVLLFVSYAVLIKPVLFMLILGIFGFRKHTLFQTSINLSQVSEFSLIVILVGVKMGVASTAALTVIALTGVASMIISSILISHSSVIYKHLSSLFTFFERKNYHHFLERVRIGENLRGHVVVIGGHRVGGEIIKFLKKERIGHIVLDFNPTQIEDLQKMGVKVIYGDMSDPEVLDALFLKEARMIISTAPGVEDNLTLLEEVRSRHIRVPVVVRAETPLDAKILYKKGADFVIVPEILAGDFLAEKLRQHLKEGGYFKGRAKIELARLSRKTLAWE